MNEADIPCSDCGTDLVERSVDVQNLPVSMDWQGNVRIADCPACGARYYPERTLARLTRHRNDSEKPRGSS